MTYVVIENCVNCKFLHCETVCPTNCFYKGENFLVINESECINCGICVRECPSEAIIYEKKLNFNQKLFIKINFNLSKI